MNLKIKKLRESAWLPLRASDSAAGYDLYAVGDDEASVTIKPHETAMIHTGIAMQIPPNFFGAIFARSGLASKRGLRPANCVGVVDSDYRGEIMVALHNDTEREQDIHPGERIAQIVFIPYKAFLCDVVDELDETERGDGGFGSTGTTEIPGQMELSDFIEYESVVEI